MSQAMVIDLARNAVMLALLVGGPLMLVALVVGLVVSVFQAVTSIQEQTLAFVPKLITVLGEGYGPARLRADAIS